MEYSTILLLYVSAVVAYERDAYRCIGLNGVDANWQVTPRCCNNLRQGDCYCSHRAEYYCDLIGEDAIQKSKQCCGAIKDYTFREY